MPRIRNDNINILAIYIALSCATGICAHAIESSYNHAIACTKASSRGSHHNQPQPALKRANAAGFQKYKPRVSQNTSHGAMGFQKWKPLGSKHAGDAPFSCLNFHFSATFCFTFSPPVPLSHFLCYSNLANPPPQWRKIIFIVGGIRGRAMPYTGGRLHGTGRGRC